MTNSFILPVKYPRITCHPDMVALISILECIPESREWIYTNFILVEAFEIFEGYAQGTKDLVMVPGYDFSYFCPWIWRGEFNPATVNELCGDIIDFIKKAIRQNNYLLIMVDESKINALKRSESFFHNLFIYGYDETAQQLLVGDFTFKERFSFEKISFDEFRNAYKNVLSVVNKLDGNGGVTLWHMHRDVSYRLDIQFVKQRFVDYLNGYSYMNQCVKGYYQAPDNVIGINVYTFLCEGMEKLKETTSDMRKCLHNLYEHKRLMVERLEYMIKQGYISEREILNECKEIAKMAEVSCNLYIKFQLTQKWEMRDRIKELLREMKAREEKVYLKIIGNL